jgi:hypothetical protein
MIVTVSRQIYSDRSIIGNLDIDGQWECYTEEPAAPTGDNPVKPYCIPAGTYQVKVIMSPHFGVPTPHILNVPGFEDIEIHNGNYPRDTHGCTLVGATRSADFVGNSLLAFGALMAKLPSEFEITYVDKEEAISA